jgi:hypothetical protein
MPLSALPVEEGSEVITAYMDNPLPAAVKPDNGAGASGLKNKAEII